jgi:hypothetical protein
MDTVRDEMIPVFNTRGKRRNDGIPRTKQRKHHNGFGRETRLRRSCQCRGSEHIAPSALDSDDWDAMNPLLSESGGALSELEAEHGYTTAHNLTEFCIDR